MFIDSGERGNREETPTLERNDTDGCLHLEPRLGTEPKAFGVRDASTNWATQPGLFVCLSLRADKALGAKMKAQVWKRNIPYREGIDTYSPKQSHTKSSQSDPLPRVCPVEGEGSPKGTKGCNQDSRINVLDFFAYSNIHRKIVVILFAKSNNSHYYYLLGTQDSKHFTCIISYSVL